MRAIIQYFSNIWYFITTVAKLIWHLISNIGEILGYIDLVTNFALDFIDTLPVYIQYFAIITVLISVLFVIIGRTGGQTK